MKTSPRSARWRVFLTLRHDAAVAPDDTTCPVHIARPTMADMSADAFGPILREGGEEIAVPLRVQYGQRLSKPRQNRRRLDADIAATDDDDATRLPVGAEASLGRRRPTRRPLSPPSAHRRSVDNR